MKLTKEQERCKKLIKASDWPTLWLGTIRAGKTWGSIATFLEKMEKEPGLYLLGAHTAGNIERNMFPAIHAYFHKRRIKWELRERYPMSLTVGKSKAFLMSGYDESSAKAIQGVTLKGALLDEALLLPQSFIMQVVARLSEENAMLLMTANRVNLNHWMKVEWVDHGVVQVIDSHIKDNPHISKKKLEWYDKLLVGHYKKAMLENEWAGEGNPVCRHILKSSKSEKADIKFYSAFLNPHGMSAMSVIEAASNTFHIVSAHKGTIDEIGKEVNELSDKETCYTNDCSFIDTLEPKCHIIRVRADVDELADCLTGVSEDMRLKVRDKGWKAISSAVGSWIWRARGKAETPDEIAAAVAQAVFLNNSPNEPFAIRRI